VVKNLFLPDMYLFQTENLLVRQLQAADYPAFYELQSDPEVLRYSVVDPDLSEEAIRDDLDRLIWFYSQPHSGLRVWAVVNHCDELIGTCALVKGEGDEAEIGYRLLRKYWGQRYGLEIGAGLIRYALTVLKLPKITAVVCKSNIPSVRILDRLMRLVGEEYNHEFKDVDRIYELVAGEETS
jgi:[ribosomal protein S5]-alanine N-acetyltransferase